MSLSETEVQAVLAKLVDPNTGKDFAATRSVKGVKVAGGAVSLEIELGYPGKSQFEPIRRLVIEALKAAGAPGASACSMAQSTCTAGVKGVLSFSWAAWWVYRSR